MTQLNIAYNWNIINMSTLTHALLLLVPRPSLPPRRPTLPKPNLPRPSLPRPTTSTESSYTPTRATTAVDWHPALYSGTPNNSQAYIGDVWSGRDISLMTTFTKHTCDCCDCNLRFISACGNGFMTYFVLYLSPQCLQCYSP